MSTHKHIDRICCVVVSLALVFTILFMNAEKLGFAAAPHTLGYEDKLFSTENVHTLDLEIDDWDGFLKTAMQETYKTCSVCIDGETYANVAIRAKGNTSLSQVAQYGNDRYSFKVEFDHYDDSQSYHGLDKLSLNNIIQDNTYMKDYLTYRLMTENGVDAPLCSFVYITVNGEDWGLYLAVEGIEDSFLQRCYGSDQGELYKPDSMSMGGGRGNGKGFDMEKFKQESAEFDATDRTGENRNNTPSSGGEAPGFGDMPTPPGNGKAPDFDDMPTPPGNGEAPDFDDMPTPPGNGEAPGIPDNNKKTGSGTADSGEKADRKPQMNGKKAGADDVALIYSDDEFDSYSDIFDNAKTDISNKDKARLIASLKQLNANENIADIVDTEKVIRYFVVHNFVVNFDSYTGSMIHNYYLYEKDGKMSMIPWDYNLAFGGFQGADNAASLVNYPIDSPVSGGTVDSRPMLAWIFNNSAYTELYHQYFREFVETALNKETFTAEFDRVKKMITPFVQKDPTKFCTEEEFEKGAETLKQFCLLRAESIRGQLDGTIPSTADGQAADKTALVPAPGLTVSDMGGMGKGKPDSGAAPDMHKKM